FWRSRMHAAELRVPRSGRRASRAWRVDLRSQHANDRVPARDGDTAAAAVSGAERRGPAADVRAQAADVSIRRLDAASPLLPDRAGQQDRARRLSGVPVERRCACGPPMARGAGGYVMPPEARPTGGKLWARHVFRVND